MAQRSPRLTFTQRIQAALVAVVVSAMIVGSYILLSVRALDRLAAEEIRTYDAANAARALETQSLRYGLALRQYVNTGNPAFLEEMDSHVLASTAGRERLLELTRLDEIREATDRFASLSQRRAQLADSVVRIASSDRTERLDSALASHRESEGAVHDALAGIIDIERVVSARTRATRQASHRAFERNVMIAVGVAVFIITTLLYSVVLGGVTRRVRQLTEMARRVAAGDYSQRPADSATNDELTVLVRTFNEMAAQLAEFDKVKEEFVALAAHQLRTPATGVKGNLGMLLEGYCGPLTDEQLEMLRDADDCNERQLALISDLLVVARTDSGRLLLSKDTADLGALLDEIIAEHRPGADARGHTLTLERPRKDMVIDMDAQKMRMVIDNLVDNAIKYTPDGGRLTVSASVDDSTAAVTVADTGVGITEDDQAKMFRKFGRVPNPMSDKVGGTGLGLYLANEIVKLHGGTIRLESTPGAGTTFTVTLPKELPA
jgi:signal transduction histidine kinase